MSTPSKRRGRPPKTLLRDTHPDLFAEIDQARCAVEGITAIPGPRSLLLGP